MVAFFTLIVSLAVGWCMVMREVVITNITVEFDIKKDFLDPAICDYFST